MVGVLTLYHAENDAFTPDHLRILLAISSKMALAIENALKYEQAESSATTDYLTGLPNARSLFLQLDRELARCKRDSTPLIGHGLRPGRLQADQRPLRPPGRQPRAAAVRAGAEGHAAANTTMWRAWAATNSWSSRRA